MAKKGEGHIGDFYDKVTGGTVDAAAFEGVVERETRVSGSVLYTPRRWLRLQGTVGASEIKNKDHIADGTESNTPFRLDATVVW
jgi:hypothetical protein